VHRYIQPRGASACAFSLSITEQVLKFRSGKVVARKRASNDADVSTTSPIIPYGEFSPVRLEGWPFRRGLPSATSSLSLLPAFAGHRTGLRPSFARLVTASLAPRCVGPDRFDCAPPLSVSTYPRGPRSGSGYRVPIHHHLIGPIRPARRHIVISPHSGLYAMPSLCGSASATRERFRAFTARSFLACRLLGPRGARSSSVPDQRCRHRLRHE